MKAPSEILRKQHNAQAVRLVRSARAIVSLVDGPRYSPDAYRGEIRTFARQLTTLLTRLVEELN